MVNDPKWLILELKLKGEKVGNPFGTRTNLHLWTTILADFIDGKNGLKNEHITEMTDF